MGNKIADNFKEGITSFLPDKENHRMYVQLVLEYMIRSDFDEGLEGIDYIVSRGTNITMISIPTKKYIVLISAERDVNSQDVIEQANMAFTTRFLTSNSRILNQNDMQSSDLSNWLNTFHFSS